MISSITSLSPRKSLRDASASMRCSIRPSRKPSSWQGARCERSVRFEFGWRAFQSSFRRWSPMMAVKIKRSVYADMFGPTTGDRVRLADTDLIIEVEKDFNVYGGGGKFGGGKGIRE